MEKNLQKELDKSRFLFVKYGLIVTFLVLIAILFALSMLKIGEESILSMVIDYYFSERK